MRKIFLGLAAVAAVATTPALAATASNTMPVSVNVINSCTVAATPMSFGTVTAIGTGAIDTTATVSLVCTLGAAYDVAMDTGTHFANGTRNLNNAAGTSSIPYGVYTDAARSANWGATSGTNTVKGTSATGTESFTAYGRIPATAQSVPAGAYTDTVTVTVTF